jgi:type IV secretion system protein TrbL
VPWKTEIYAAVVPFLLVPLGISLVFVVLIRTIPELVQGIINGTSLATGAGLYATATGFAAGAVAQTVSAGMAARSAGQLASEQLTDAELAGQAPASPAARAGWLGVRSAASLGGAALQNVGDRLSGRVPPHGTRMGQVSGAMDRDREAKIKERTKEASAAVPPSVTPPAGPPKPPSTENKDPTS